MFLIPYRILLGLPFCFWFSFSTCLSRCSIVSLLLVSTVPPYNPEASLAFRWRLPFCFALLIPLPSFPPFCPVRLIPPLLSPFWFRSLCDNCPSPYDRPFHFTFLTSFSPLFVQFLSFFPRFVSSPPQPDSSDPSPPSRRFRSCPPELFDRPAHVRCMSSHPTSLNIYSY